MTITGLKYEPWGREVWNEHINLLKQHWKLKEHTSSNSIKKHNNLVKDTIRKLVRHAPEVSED